MSKQKEFLYRLKYENYAPDSVYDREEFLELMCRKNLIEEIEPHLFRVRKRFTYYTSLSNQKVTLIEGKEFFRLPKYTAKEAK